MDIVADALIVAVVLIGGVAHGIVLRFDLLKVFQRPLDGGRVLRGAPVFGANKTWRGVVVMTLSLSVAGALLFPVRPPDVHPPAGSWVRLGPVLGVAYVTAELPNSFVKRRLGIAPGAVPLGPARAVHGLLDLADSVIGVVVALVVFGLGWRDALVLLVAGTAVHGAFDVLLRAVGAKHDVKPAARTRVQSP